MCVCVSLQVDMYADALFIQLALRWNIYVAIVLLLSITALYTVAGDDSTSFAILKHIQIVIYRLLHVLCVVSQVVWLQSSTQTLLKLLSCWQELLPSWASVSHAPHQTLPPAALYLPL